MSTAHELDGRAAYVGEIIADTKGNVSRVIDTDDRAKAQTYETEADAQTAAEWLRSSHYTVRVEAL